MSADATFELLLATLDAQQLTASITETLRPRVTAATPALPALSVSSRDDCEAEFVVHDTLGQGAAGEVCAAYQQSLQRSVALKRLRRDVTQTDPGALVVEARVLGRLEHPNVVPVYALGTDADGRPSFVMKRVEGVSWRSLIHDPAEHEGLLGGRTPLEAHVDILRQMCGALARAHSQGILHLDVKPDNVMIGAYGEVYLVDWGVAAARRPGVLDGLAVSGGRIVGTPAYMAPEQARGDPASERTDVYLLGACLYEVLLGHPPRANASVKDALRVAASGRYDALPADAQSMLHLLVRASMAPHPSQRPEGPMAFAQALAEGHNAMLAEAMVVGAEASADALRDHLEDGDTVGVARLLADARRGFEAALSQAPRYLRAVQGKRDLLRTVALFELQRGAADRAKAVVAEDAVLQEELGAAIAAVEASRAERVASADERRWLRDLSRGRDRRMAVLAAAWCCVVGLIWSSVWLQRTGRLEIGYGPMVLTICFLTLVGLVLRQREQGAAVRRIHGNLMGFVTTGVLLGLLWALDWPASVAMSVGLYTAGCATAVVAVTTDRNMGPASAWVLLGAAATLVFPAAVWEVAAITVTLGAVTVVAGEWLRSRPS